MRFFSREPGSRGSGAARKAVVVHSGARDGYQVARALEEAGLLEALVTDLYWPADRPWAGALARLLPAALGRALGARSEPRVPSHKVRTLPLLGSLVFALDRLPARIPFAARRGATRRADAALGTRAGRLARHTGAGLISYSYYGYQAFSASGAPGMLFQLHPHPASVRRILRQELSDHPEAAASLEQEWELALPEPDFRRLVEETRMASRFLVASSFTRQTLIDNGTPADAITVVPYGVDCTRFRPASEPRAAAANRGGPLRLLFVGRINQRKGIGYLLAAVRRFPPSAVHLTVCGRVVDGLELFRGLGEQVTVRTSVSEPELLRCYGEAELFLLPSVAEGFGQVLLEAMACGLPVVGTTATAAPDLIVDGREGFVLEPRSSDALAGAIEWALAHRGELREMGRAARARAESLTWARFREGVVAAVRPFLAEPSAPGDRTGSGSGSGCEVDTVEVGGHV